MNHCIQSNHPVLILYPAVALFVCLVALFSSGIFTAFFWELFMFSTSVELGVIHCLLSFSVFYAPFFLGRAEYFISELMTDKKRKSHAIFLFPWDHLLVFLGPILDMFVLLIFHITHYFFMIISYLHSIFVAITVCH